MAALSCTGLLAAAPLLAACAPYARLPEAPNRASLGAFYTSTPRADAQDGYRAELAYDRWLDDRFLVGVDAEYATFARTRGRTETLAGGALRVTYVVDLGEVQPRAGVRGAMQRWTHGDGTLPSTPFALVPFGALDWAPRTMPIVLGAEVQAPSVLTLGTSPASAGLGYGLRAAYAF